MLRDCASQTPARPCDAVRVPPALLKAIQDGTRTGLDADAMQRCTYCEERAVPDADWAGLAPASGGGFLAALVNPGWECEGRGDAAVQVGPGLAGFVEECGGWGWRPTAAGQACASA